VAEQGQGLKGEVLRITGAEQKQKMKSTSPVSEHSKSCLHGFASTFSKVALEKCRLNIKQISKHNFPAKRCSRFSKHNLRASRHGGKKRGW